jgi:peptidyl-prolyl cis-trans isomerase C
MTARPAKALGADRASERRSARGVALGASLLLALSAGCRRDSAAVRPSPVALPSGAVARVGSSPIAGETVERIQDRQQLTPKMALERATSDALFALEAELRLPGAARAAVERAALARVLLEELGRAAQAKGPATDAELESITAERWVDLDRPPSVRVSHAVALHPAEGARAPALSVARALEQAVRGVREPEAFLRAARAVPAGDIKVRAERLPYLTADGRGISTDRQRAPAGQFDPTFTRAANQLKEPGELSPIVETRFGYHVILLEERLPERRVSMEDRRVALTAEALTRRADTLRRELVSALKSSTRIEVRRDAEQQTAKLNE